MQLLKWGKEGIIVAPYSIEKQKKLLFPLKDILTTSGCNISMDGERIIATKGNHQKRVVVYPAMWVEPKKRDTICISDAYLVYSKPYAVQKILDEI